MDTPNLLTLNEKNFEREVLDASTPVLVDFAADWCPPCRALEPTIAELSDQYAGEVKVGRVDVDVNPELSARFEVSSIPTILLFKDGEITHRFVGLTAREEFVQAIERAAA